MSFLFNFLLLGLIGGVVSSLTFGPVRVSLLDVATATLLIGWVIAKGKKIVPAVDPLLRVAGPFLFVALLSLVVAGFRLSITELLTAALYLVRFAVFLVLLVIVSTTVELKKSVRFGLLISGMVIALLGFLQYFLYPNLRNLSYLGWDPHEFRLFSSFFDPNFTGILLVLTIILVFITRIHHRKIVNLVWVGVLILLLIALLLTYSRGSYVALVVVGAVFALKERQFKWLLIGGSVFLLTLVLLPRPGGEGVRLLRTMSISSRIDNSVEAIRLWRTSPLIGVGFNTIRYVRSAPPENLIQIENAHSAAGFHNSYLFLLVTVGIIGFVCFFWMGKKLWELVEVRHRQLLGLTVLAIGIHSLFDNSLFYPPVLVWLSVLWGGSIRD